MGWRWACLEQQKRVGSPEHPVGLVARGDGWEPCSDKHAVSGLNACCLYCMHRVLSSTQLEASLRHEKNMTDVAWFYGLSTQLPS